MPDLLTLLTNLSWPLAICLAWLAGEFGQRYIGLPRISFYGLAGFLLGAPQLGALPHPGAGPELMLADVAFGLILFELGYRIHLRWLVTNPWLGAACVMESLATFVAVYVLADAFGLPSMNASLLAALAMSTSPATVIVVINELRSSGQVSERVLHLSAFNCVLAAFTFNTVAALSVRHSWAELGDVALAGLAGLVISGAVGALFGLVVPAVLRRLGDLAQDATVGFALAVILLVSMTYSVHLSPVVAALAFGVMARHRRVVFSQAQRNFGALGELLTVLLFVFAAATLDWRQLASGWALALAVLAVRLLTKTLGVAMFARLSGITWRKGVLSGLALAPFSVFAILLLEHARLRGLQVSADMQSVVAIVMLLEVFGPILIQRALVMAGEARRGE
jgi:Kef-type K+ transport system membrane component KefB